MNKVWVLDTESTNVESIVVGNESTIDISLTNDWDLAQLEAAWIDLEGRADSNAFLSWAWIKPWLSICKEKPLLIEAKVNSLTVGLGLLTPKVQCLLPGVSINKLWLHRFGCSVHDQVWIEHNDFLLDCNSQSLVRARMIDFLLSEEAGYDEIFLGLTTSEVEKQLLKNFDNIRTDINSETYLLDLSSFTSLDDYLKSLSKNSRSQIVRSKKLLEGKYGSISVTRAESQAEKVEYLQKTAELHRLRWAEDEYGSGFDNSIFNQFHTEILTEDTDNSATSLLCLRAGEKALGYIYLLKDKGSWKFYLSALNLEDDNRIKVGLLFHALVIEKAIEAGVKTYDFLAGEARYKNSLSNTSDYQSLLCIYRPRLIIRLRESLRQLKRFFVKKKAMYINR